MEAEVVEGVDLSLQSEYTYDQTTDSDVKPSFDETVSDSNSSPPIARDDDDFDVEASSPNSTGQNLDDSIPDQNEFNSELVSSSPVKTEAPHAFDEEEVGDQEEKPADESWAPISDKKAKQEAKKAQKQQEKEEKDRLAREKKEEKEREKKEQKERQKEQKEREKQERASKREAQRASKREKSPKPVKEKPEKKMRPQVRGPNMGLAKVQMLDGETLEIEIEKSAKGHVLNDVVCDSQSLEEKDYFGLIYFTRNSAGQNVWFWLDPEKKINRQLKGSEWEFEFRVKFYPPEPTIMKEDITRYFLCQQIRNDIIMKRLPCSMLTAAILGSYTVQSEIGDYDEETAEGIVYLRDYQFYPDQTPELLLRISDLHKVHNGQTPADADIHFLENSMRLAMYGVDLHEVMDSEGTHLMLGVCWAGINVYKDRLRINRFPWPKILKISYKKSRFFVKIRPAEFDHFESTIGFKLVNHRMTKRLWKVAVEQHTFFRKKEPEMKHKARMLPRFGSKFRYSGRTIYQSRMAMIDRPSPAIDRSFTLRKSRSMNMGSVNQLNLEGYGGYRQDSYNTTNSTDQYAQIRRGGSHEHLPPSAIEEEPVETQHPENDKVDEEQAERGEVEVIEKRTPTLVHREPVYEGEERTPPVAHRAPVQESEML